MRVFFLSLIVVFLFSGCVSKETVVKEDLFKEEAVSKSKTLQIKKDNKIQAYLVVTYLNQIENKPFLEPIEAERFIISVYVGEKVDKTLFNELSFELNKQKPTLFKELKKGDKLLNILPGQNSWVKYYYIEVPKVESENLIFGVTTKSFGASSVHFIKFQL